MSFVARVERVAMYCKNTLIYVYRCLKWCCLLEHLKCFQKPSNHCNLISPECATPWVVQITIMTCVHIKYQYPPTVLSKFSSKAIAWGQPHLFRKPTSVKLVWKPPNFKSTKVSMSFSVTICSQKQHHVLFVPESLARTGPCLDPCLRCRRLRACPHEAK